MKKLLFWSAVICVISACNQSNSQKAVESKRNGNAEIADTLCFSSYSGLENQDTAYVKLIIKGDNVTGNFSNFPYEKDSRIGTVTGVKSGNLIKGTWHYQQEGINDSISYEFRLEDNKLLQKKTSYDLNTGLEVLTDTAAFSIEFLKADCKRVR